MCFSSDGSHIWDMMMVLVYSSKLFRGKLKTMTSKENY